jgi:hypothetical protein
MSTPNNKERPYAALRYPEFNTFLLLLFAMVFAWSMQFIVIEWQVYSITKTLSRTNVIPCFYGFVCWPHSGSEKKSLLVKCILAFSVISFGLFLLTWRWSFYHR